MIAGAISLTTYFKNLADIKSGPVDLFCFNLSNSFFTPSKVTIMSGILVHMGDNKCGVMSSSFENTLANWSLSIVAFFLSSV